MNSTDGEIKHPIAMIAVKNRKVSCQGPFWASLFVTKPTAMRLMIVVFVSAPATTKLKSRKANVLFPKEAFRIVFMDSEGTQASPSILV